MTWWWPCETKMFLIFVNVRNDDMISLEIFLTWLYIKKDVKKLKHLKKLILSPLQIVHDKLKVRTTLKMF